MVLEFRWLWAFLWMILTMETLSAILLMTMIAHSHHYLDSMMRPFSLCHRIKFPTVNRPFLVFSEGGPHLSTFHCHSVNASAFSPGSVRPLFLHCFSPAMK